MEHCIGSVGEVSTTISTKMNIPFGIDIGRTTLGTGDWIFTPTKLSESFFWITK
jgi:hypothetical protein